MNWVNNLIEYSKTGEKGNCPKCGSSEVTVETTNFGRRSLTFHCNKCGSWNHFDGTATAKEKQLR